VDLWIDLPVAGTSVPLLLVMGIGVLVGGLSGFYGVGAGFLFTPLLISIGVPPVVAAASCANHCVAASASGALAHGRAGAFDPRAVLLLLAGGLLGGTVGVQIVGWLREIDQADLAVTLVYIGLLGGLGLHLLRDSVLELRGEKPVCERRASRRLRPPLLPRLLAVLPFRVHLRRADVRTSALVPVTVGLGAGLLVAFTGVGGGILLVPAALAIGIPVHLAVGSALLLVCLSALNVTFQHAALHGTVDVLLALVLFLGSVPGARLGAWIGRRLRADQLRILLAVIVLFAGAKLVADLVLPPEAILVPVGGGPR
jgi:uncharacterized membrane protein YfcA